MTTLPETITLTLPDSLGAEPISFHREGEGYILPLGLTDMAQFSPEPVMRYLTGQGLAPHYRQKTVNISVTSIPAHAKSERDWRDETVPLTRRTAILIDTPEAVARLIALAQQNAPLLAPEASAESLPGRFKLTFAPREAELPFHTLTMRLIPSKDGTPNYATDFGIDEGPQKAARAFLQFLRDKGLAPQTVLSAHSSQLIGGVVIKGQAESEKLAAIAAQNPSAVDLSAIVAQLNPPTAKPQAR